jgi:GNAT superfamily N-acetyltransferase
MVETNGNYGITSKHTSVHKPSLLLPVKRNVTPQIQMTVHYRKYKNDDLETLQKLMSELGYWVELDELKSNATEISKKGGSIVVAEINNDIVGCVCIVVDVRLAEGPYAEIVNLIVTEKIRGKGIGKALIKEAENWASTRVSKIKVRAKEIRKDAHAFYISQGFKYTKTQKVFIKNMQSGTYAGKLV